MTAAESGRCASCSACPAKLPDGDSTRTETQTHRAAMVDIFGNLSNRMAHDGDRAAHGDTRTVEESSALP